VTTSRLEKTIAKRLGVTPAGLHLLAKLLAKSVGAKIRTGTGGQAAVALERLGHVKDGEITASGIDVVNRARRMGY
jgi:hypothetical protein